MGRDGSHANQGFDMTSAPRLLVSALALSLTPWLPALAQTAAPMPQVPPAPQTEAPVPAETPAAAGIGEAPVAPAKPDGYSGDYAVLQPLADGPGVIELPDGTTGPYLPSTVETVTWGYLPNRDAEPLMTVESGATVVIDTLSHEGILEDQGRDPVAYFGSKGVPEDAVLADAIAVAASDIEHDFFKDGPHVVTGPIAIEGAEPGDVLKVETLELLPRVPYGVVSNRHGKGALVGEFPETPPPDPNASPEQPELYHNVSVFTPLRLNDSRLFGVMHNRDQGEVVFPANPFLGILGVAADTSEKVHSVPPGKHGGNLDISMVGVGTTLYLPVQVPGALFYASDPHAAQGNGEVALTALELSMRAKLRVTLLKKGDPAIPYETLAQPFAETDEFWMPVGLNEDLDEAVKDAVRQSIAFLTGTLNMDRPTALAYLSAATDFNISQVVDRTKGVHAQIRKADFATIRGADGAAE